MDVVVEWFLHFKDKVLLIHVRPGVTAGKAAGMEVVAVPFLPKQSHLYTSADEVINSLLDLRPEKWGLPPFEDCKPLSQILPNYSKADSVAPILWIPLILNCRGTGYFTNRTLVYWWSCY